MGVLRSLKRLPALGNVAVFVLALCDAFDFSPVCGVCYVWSTLLKSS